MASEIGLQELLAQVKRELLVPAGDDPAPLFYVESVDLELAVSIRKEGEAGIKVYVVELGASGGVEHAQKIRVALRPLFTREEMRSLAEQDPILGPLLEQAAKQGILKGDLLGD